MSIGQAQLLQNLQRVHVYFSIKNIRFVLCMYLLFNNPIETQAREAAV